MPRVKAQQVCQAAITHNEAYGIWSTPTLREVVWFSFLKVLKQNSFFNHFQGSAYKLVAQWGSSPRTKGCGKAAKSILRHQARKGREHITKSIFSVTTVKWPRSNKNGQRIYIFQGPKCKRESVHRLKHIHGAFWQINR